MSASEKDLNNLGHAHSGSNTPGNTAGGHVASQDVSGVTYYGHSQSQPHTLQNNQHGAHNSSSSAAKPQSSQKPPSVHKPQSALPANQKSKQTPARIAPSQPTTVKPSATTNAPPRSAPTPTPPGSSAVMAAVMAQAQAAAGQAVAAQQAKQQAPPSQAQAAAPPQAHPAPAPPPAPAPGQPPPQPYPYPYPYYLPPGQPGAPPYLYPGAPGAPAFLPPGAPAQGGAPPPGYPYVYPMYPAPIPVPQTSPVPAAKEKKSQRTYQACQKCRQWKAKCNGLKPCNHCQKRGVPCEYAERRNMPGPNEAGSSDPPAAPSSPDGAGSKSMDTKPTSQDSGAAQAAPTVAAGAVTAPPPQPQQIAPQPQPQAAPPAASPPQQAQPQHPPPMAVYPPPPPGYTYPPQLYPGIPFPPPPGDPNAPYAHFISMQYPQPYGPYIWGPPPPPPGHEPPPASNPADGEDVERDADGKLKIKRTFQACQKCRQRKAKCNGARPSCQHCTSRGLNCEYAKERSKPRGPNGEEGDESPTTQHAEPPTTMDPSQATINADSTSSGGPHIPPVAPPNMLPPPFSYDPNAYNPHVDPQQHGAQPMYPFPPYPYGHPPGFGSIAGPPLVHMGEEGSVATYHPPMAQPVPVSGSPPAAAPSGSSSKRPRAARPPGVPGSGKSRIFQACERCRERKAKCDGARPVCSHCAARDLNCEWAGKRRMRGPAKGITPRRNRAEHTFIAKGPMDMNTPMPAIPIGLSTAGLQTIEQHPLPADGPRKRKRGSSHSSRSPSPSSSSSSSESSPSESDDDDQHGGIGAGHDGMGAVTAPWS
ncbi:Fungal Zn(2)-Cys(6) binuclear cluster domain [Ceratobasidium sp. AG-Ba]|nr:Fungal Zn(2)-Cys(6) binuclear cluster domain [Ceratobasidium sp. AG-Ba]